MTLDLLNSITAFKTNGEHKQVRWNLKFSSKKNIVDINHQVAVVFYDLWVAIIRKPYEFDTCRFGSLQMDLLVFHHAQIPVEDVHIDIFFYFFDG